ncbi:MAG: hypothetical protein IKU36_06120 [Bacteroidales bacterium]|nr:hypothetical protein [Bacteroidales bacterium]
MKLRTIIAVLAAGLLSLSASAAPVAKWGETPAGMPYVQYTGSFASGDVATDPYFLLGNYRMNLLTHASGTYQLMSGERVWARFNADPERPDYGRNKAVLKIEDKSYDLIGNNKQTESDDYTVTSGVGFTRYDYVLDGGIKCSRMISVMPSENVNEGIPSFLLTVTLRNTSNSALKVTYEEILLPCFVPVNEQNLAVADRSYRYSYTTAFSFRCVTASFSPVVQKYVHWASEDEPTMYENTPKPMFVYSPDAFIKVLDSGIHAVMEDVKVRPGHTKTFHYVIGIADGDVKVNSDKLLDVAEDGQFGAFASMWKAALPDFKAEKDNVRRREMYWNAHMLEASAVYDEYFADTFVPAGSDLTYRYGKKTSMLDNIHSVLPLCYSDPELAKSVLRYVMKHVDPFGRIYDGNLGSGHVMPSSPDECELQANLFHAVSEYLRITKDAAFLEEFIEVKASGKSRFISVLSVLESCFFYLRDECPAAGSQQYDMQLSAVFPSFVDQLKASGKASAELIKAMEQYNNTVKLPLADPASLENAELAYMIRSHKLQVSEKRKCLDVLIERQGDVYDFATEYGFLIGALSFDRIEASGISKRLSFARIDENGNGGWIGAWSAPSVLDENKKSVHPYSSSPHAWSLYSYYRMLE